MFYESDTSVSFVVCEFLGVIFVLTTLHNIWCSTVTKRMFIRWDDMVLLYGKSYQMPETLKHNGFINNIYLVFDINSSILVWASLC